MEQKYIGGVKVSIITVVYNDVKGFRYTAESICRQSAMQGTDWEWIVIDGGSTDGTVDEIKRQESYTSFWVSEKDAGIYDAMNKGIAHAQGLYLLFMNAGDSLCDSDVIARVVAHEAFAKSDYLIGHTYHTKNGKHVGKPDIFPDAITGKLLYMRSMPHQATFMRTERVRALGGYDTSYRIMSDWKFCFQDIIMNNATSTTLGFFTTYYDVTGLSATSYTQSLSESERLFKELLPERIINDYNRLCYGETTLERLLCKMPERSMAYRALTVAAAIIYSPVAIYHRLRMKLKKKRLEMVKKISCINYTNILTI